MILWFVYAFFIGAAAGMIVTTICIAVYGDPELNESVARLRQLRREMHIAKTKYQCKRLWLWAARKNRGAS